MSNFKRHHKVTFQKQDIYAGISHISVCVVGLTMHKMMSILVFRSD